MKASFRTKRETLSNSSLLMFILPNAYQREFKCTQSSSLRDNSTIYLTLALFTTSENINVGPIMAPHEKNSVVNKNRLLHGTWSGQIIYF